MMLFQKSIPQQFTSLQRKTLKVLPNIRMIFQVIIQRSNNVQFPVVHRFDQTANNLETSLFQGEHWQRDVCLIHIGSRYEQLLLVDEEAIVCPRVPE